MSGVQATVEVAHPGGGFPLPGPQGPQGSTGGPIPVHFGVSPPPDPTVGDLWLEAESPQFVGPDWLGLPYVATDNYPNEIAWLDGPFDLAPVLSGGLDARWLIVSDGAPTGEPASYGTRTPNTEEMAFRFRRAAAGYEVQVYDSTGAGRILGTVLPPGALYDRRGLRLTYNPATGDWVKYWSTDDGATWTQHDSGTLSAPIGLHNVAGSVNTRNRGGALIWFQLFTLAGVRVASCDCSFRWPGTTFTDRQGNTWSINGTGWVWAP